MLVFSLSKIMILEKFVFGAGRTAQRKSSAGGRGSQTPKISKPNPSALGAPLPQAQPGRLHAGLWAS